jgi:hypothetical protein
MPMHALQQLRGWEGSVIKLSICVNIRWLSPLDKVVLAPG